MTLSGLNEATALPEVAYGPSTFHKRLIVKRKLQIHWRARFSHLTGGTNVDR